MNNPYAMLKLQPAQEGVLNHAVDRYQGVTIPDSSLQSITDVDAFSEILTRSLEEWTKQKRRGIWMQVPVEKSAFIAPAAAMGFECHHAQPKYIMMTLWLPEKVHGQQQQKPVDAQTSAAVGAAAEATGSTNRRRRFFN